MKRSLLIPAAAVLALGLSACTAGAEADVASEFRPWVETDYVQKSTLDRSLVLTGAVDGGRTVHLLPMTAAKVESLPVKVGDMVTKGQVLARLDMDMARLQHQQAEAAVGLATIGLETAEREFRRAESLHASGTLTDQQFEQARAGLDMAGLQLSQATAAKGLSQEQLTDGTVVAPFDGLVASVGADEGNWFNPMSMNPMAPGGLVTVVDLSTVKVDVAVTDRNISLVQPGMPAVLEVDALGDLLPDGLQGTVDFVGYSADPSSRTFPVRVVAANPERAVRAGMHARVRLVLDRAVDAIWVTETAILDADVGQYVLVVQDDLTVAVSPVKLGVHGDHGVQIVSGLDGGEEIVVKGGYGVAHGSSVEVGS